MFGSVLTHPRTFMPGKNPDIGPGRDSGVTAVSGLPDEARRYFREKYPILLDGALPASVGQGYFVRQAEASLARGGLTTEHMPAAILRETLAGIASSPAPRTAAGMTAIGPRRMRVWWDDALLDATDDVIASLDKPRPVLRFYDVTGVRPGDECWDGVFDIDIELAHRGKSVDFWSPDRSYVVDLGLAHADGRFLRLARTNPADLPRECGSNRNPGKTARSSLSPRSRAKTALRADAAARAWAGTRPDHPDRDVEAELFIHMIYRAFLAEGPRALRNFSAPSRRDPDLLRREYERRERRRARQTAVPADPAAKGPAILVARLDTHMESKPAAAISHPAVPVMTAARKRLYAGAHENHLGYFLSLARLAGRIDPYMLNRPRLAAPVRVDAKPAAPAIRAVAADIPLRQAEADLASARAFPNALPLFRAARELGERLSRHPDAANGVKHEAASPRSSWPDASRPRADRYERIPLILSGRVRAGARIRVGGRTIQPDADGRFRLECVLTGKNTRIPLLAGVPEDGGIGN